MEEAPDEVSKSSELARIHGDPVFTTPRIEGKGTAASAPNDSTGYHDEHLADGPF